MKYKIIVLFLLLGLTLQPFSADRQTSPTKTVPKEEEMSRSPRSEERETREERPAPKQVEEEKKQEKEEELYPNMPKIPKDWGKLIHGEMLYDTSYLALYFEDSEGLIRVAVFEIGRKEITLKKLLVFPRGENPLKPTK